MRGLLTSAAVAATLFAATAARAEDADDTDEPVVVVNAASKLGSVDQIKRLRRVLDARNLLVKLPENLEATLDGRNVLIADLDSIKEAYASGEYDTALEIIEADEARILGEAINRDPIPALAELSQWRGIIAAALNKQDEALRWFRAAYRFNPAWNIDKKLASPRVRSMVKKAKREPDQEGFLKVYTDPDDATVRIDGGEARAAGQKIALPVGTHLVMITAPKRKPYAELVDVAENDPVRIDINLDPETTLDRAARLVDATASAPTGKSRLKSARALAKLTGVSRMLVVEDGGDDHVSVRLYDTDNRKVSKTFDLAGNASAETIARKIVAALDPDNLVDINTVVVNQRVIEGQRPTKWYARWYVWAAVGAVALGGYATYDYATREPTAVRF